MRSESEKLVACPISCSSNNDEYNDICKATGKQCPYFIDEGMSVCKSKAKCLAYFMKKGTGVNWTEVAKLVASDTKSYTGRRQKYTNTIKRDKSMQEVEREEAKVADTTFLEDLEDALKNHEEATVKTGDVLEGLEEALKNHDDTSIESDPTEHVEVKLVPALEKYKKK